MGACCQTTAPSETQTNESKLETAALSGSENDENNTYPSNNISLVKKSSIFKNTLKTKKPKPKYYLQIAKIYHRQIKVDNHWLDMQPKLYCYHDRPCQMDWDPNDLIEPFEQSDDDLPSNGKWYWIEQEWTIHQEWIPTTRTTQQKKFTRVAIYERDYECNGYIQQQIVNIIRKLLWHYHFYNSFYENENLIDEEDDGSSDSTPHHLGILAIPNHSTNANTAVIAKEKKKKKRSSYFGTFEEEIVDENPDVHPRLKPYTIFLQQIHGLAKKMYEYNHKKSLLERKSIVNVNFHSGASLDVDDIAGNGSIMVKGSSASSMQTTPKFSSQLQQVDELNHLGLEPMVVAQSVSLNNVLDNELFDVDDDEDEDDGVYVHGVMDDDRKTDDDQSFSPYNHKAFDVLVDDERKNPFDRLVDHPYESKSDGRVSNKKKNRKSKKSNVKSAAKYKYSAVSDDDLRSTRKANLHDLSSITNIFEKLSARMKIVSFRTIKYSKSSKRYLETFIYEFIETQLKLIISSNLMDHSKELVLFDCYLQMFDVSEEENNNGSNGNIASNTSPSVSSFERALQCKQNYENVSDSQLKQDCFFCIDVFGKLEEILSRVEKRYSGRSLNDRDRGETTDLDSSINTGTDDMLGEPIADSETTGTTGDDDHVSDDPLIRKILSCRYAHTILGLSDDDDHPLTIDHISKETIIKKYRKIVFKVHPDKNTDAYATDAFERVQDACQYLKIGNDFDFMEEAMMKYRMKIARDTNDNHSRYESNLSEISISRSSIMPPIYVTSTAGAGGGFSSSMIFNNNKTYRHGLLKSGAVAYKKYESTFGLSIDEYSSDAQVLNTIVPRLEAWLVDSHAHDSTTVATFFLFYKRCCLLQQCVQKHLRLSDEKIQECEVNIDFQMRKFMTSAVKKDYRRICRKINNFKGGKTLLIGHKNIQDYEDFFEDLQTCVDDCVQHIIACKKLKIFQKRPKDPLIKLIRMFFADTLKIIPALVKDLPSLKSPDSSSGSVLISNPFHPTVIYLLTKISDFRIIINRLLEPHNFHIDEQFKLAMQQLGCYIEEQLYLRFDIWINAAINDIGKLVWKILKKYPRTNKELQNIFLSAEDFEKFEKQTVHNNVIDSFTFIHNLIDSFFHLLKALPEPELKITYNKYLSLFFNRMLRIILTFIDDCRPRFAEEIKLIKDLEQIQNKNLKKNKKRSSARMEIKNDDDKTDDEVGDEIIHTQHMIHMIEKLTNIGYKKIEVENAIKVRGCINEHVIIDYLLIKDRLKFMKSDTSETDADDSLPNIIFGKKGKITNNEYEYICIMLMQMDLILSQVTKIDESMNKNINKLAKFLRPNLKSCVASFIDTCHQWCDEWIQRTIRLICKQLFIQDFKLKDKLYLSITLDDFCDDENKSNSSSKVKGDNDIENEVIDKLRPYINIFNHKFQNNSELNTLVLNCVCYQLFNVLLWILLDPQSQRKYYRSYILNSKTEHAKQKLLTDKFTHDLQIIQDIFVNEFGINVNDIQNIIHPIEECFSLMRLTTAELIYKHHKRSSRIMLLGPQTSIRSSSIQSQNSPLSRSYSNSFGFAHTSNNNFNHMYYGSSGAIKKVDSNDIFLHDFSNLYHGEIINHGMNDMLLSIIQHRQKSYAEEYVKSFINKNSAAMLNIPGSAVDDGNSSGSDDGGSSAFGGIKKLKLIATRDWPLKRGSAVITDRPLFVEIIGGHKLKNKRKFGGTSDASAVITCLDQSFSTKTLSSNLHPRWRDEGFVFLIPPNHFSKYKVLELLIEFKDKKHFLGMYTFQISMGQKFNGLRRVRFAGKNNNMLTEKEYGELEICIRSDLLFVNESRLASYACSSK